MVIATTEGLTLAIIETKSGSDKRVFVPTGGGADDELVDAVEAICAWLSAGELLVSGVTQLAPTKRNESKIKKSEIYLIFMTLTPYILFPVFRMTFTKVLL